MSFCDHCHREFETTAGQDFCDECGTPLSQTGPASYTPGITELPQQLNINEHQATTPALGNQPDDTSPRDTDLDFQQASPSQQVDIGDKVTNVYNQIKPEEYCAYGGEKVSLEHSYRCPHCGRGPLCVEHYDRGLRACAYCLDVQFGSCSICNERIPIQETKSCERCQKTACHAHWDDDRRWCGECARQWKDVVSAMDSGEVVISMGTLVGTDEIELKGNILTTNDGRPVATIKENTWYVSSKQWYRIKPQLLNREQRAMARFYPSMRLTFDGKGTACWNGDIVTWSGKKYEVSLRYPPIFPYRAPPAYIVNPKIEQSRHIYPDGHLCLFHKDDKAWQINTTAATVMSWVSLWLHCYEAWLESGHWPRPEADQVVISPKY